MFIPVALIRDYYRCRSFFLYFSYYDAHRCSRQKYGQFCEEFGDGGRNNGLIPDWTPVTFGPNDVNVPYYLPNTAVTRQELANMYKSFSRMDQGVCEGERARTVTHQHTITPTYCPTCTE